MTAEQSYKAMSITWHNQQIAQQDVFQCIICTAQPHHHKDHFWQRFSEANCEQR
jgi:hypothetical protein